MTYSLCDNAEMPKLSFHSVKARKFRTKTYATYDLISNLLPIL